MDNMRTESCSGGEGAKKRGILFDLDGTLWDATEQIMLAWNEAMARHPEANGIQLTLPQVRGYMGTTLPEIARQVMPHLAPEEAAAILDEGCVIEEERLKLYGGILYPELRETLAALKEKYELMIVSNSQDGYIQVFLEYHGLGEYFTDIEMAGRTGLPKCDNIRLVIERNALEHAYYVGDTQGDHDSAVAAGAEFIHAAYGFGTVKEPCLRVETFAELKELA